MIKIELKRPNKNAPDGLDRIVLKAEVTESTCKTEYDTFCMVRSAIHQVTIHTLDNNTIMVITMDEGGI